MSNELEPKLVRLEELNQKFIGNTPLIEVTGEDREGARIFAKAEWHNRTGSIKARCSYSMLKAAIENTVQKGENDLKIVEYTGGNQGLTLSLLGEILDIPMTLVVPGTFPEPLVKDLTLYGATVVRGDPNDGFLGAMQKAEQIAQEDNRFTFLHQQHNLANIQYFENVMAAEILSQLHEKQANTVDAWVAAIGSGGTLIGVYKGLKKFFPSLQLYCLSPKEAPYGSLKPPYLKPKLYGSGGMGCGLKQKFVEEMENHIAQHFHYSLEEAYQGMADYYRETGVFIGSSSAANLLAAKSLAKNLRKDQVVLTVFPSLALQKEIQDLKDYFVS